MTSSARKAPVRTFAGLLSVAVWLAQAPASAQQGDSQAAGRALFAEGMQLFERGNYAEACSKFEASLARLPGIGTRGKLAECYEKIGRTASAWALYSEVVVLANRAGDATREKVASERVTSLEPKLAHMAITVAPGMSSASVASGPGLVIKRNGVPLARGELGSAVAVDPGEIVIEANAPERESWSKTVSVKDGATVRVEVPILASVAPAALKPPPVSPPPPQKVEAPARPAEGLGWQRTTAIVVGGAGVASLLVGGYFGLSAKSTYDGAFDSNCQHGTNTCNSAGQQDTESAHDKARVSTILIGAGAGLIVTGVILFVTAPKRAPLAQAWRIAPSFGMGQTGVVLSGHL